MSTDEDVDFYVDSTEILPAMNSSIELILINDGVAQEDAETFTLRLISTSSISPESNFFLLDELSVTIIDTDGMMI